MSNDTLDALLAGGGKTAKFEKIGDSYTGIVTSAETRQATNFDTGKPEFWDDGNPKKQAVINIQTTERLDEDDDGVRAIYINAWGEKIKALREASRLAKGAPAVGDTFTATYIGDGPKPQKGFAPKLFKYEIVKGSPVDALLGGGAEAKAPDAFPAALNDAQKAQAAQLIALGLDDAKIATVVDGADPVAIAQLRLQQAAVGAGKGF
ncbi:MAG: hypothetical protein BGN98_13840 [Microbacterium sp. 69-7]|uniref:hypothetical protein n=1 Tax=Microbacterium sp. 69-7 TaxID=1895784 RepID=UPI00095D1AE3|nr:hypothetical protein [Microbacterium sp. 69-7]OJU44462.1 MAG: hypothetical protein BGN98_13840 [Microbacterium sp. 69-7]